jgi:hypothetical protein
MPILATISTIYIFIRLARQNIIWKKLNTKKVRRGEEMAVLSWIWRPRRRC